jgi:hypothetical protein
VIKMKFTQEEFNEHYKEFIANYTTKYSTMDLDFRMTMFMRGCSNEEFDEKINLVNSMPMIGKDYQIEPVEGADKGDEDWEDYVDEYQDDDVEEDTVDDSNEY